MPLETGAGGAAALAAAKTATAQALLGMAGAAVLYLVMPPERPDGTFSKREFASRLAVAGFVSVVAGDWAVAVVDGLWPWLQAVKHPAPFWLAAGAPGWWLSRAAALFLYNRRSKDAGEIFKELKP